MDPNTLNAESSGRWVTAYVELPLAYAPTDCVIETVMLNGSVPADTGHWSADSDFNENGIPDLTFKFDREAVEAILPESDSVELTVTGEVRDTTWFVATDVIRVIRPRLVRPNGGERLVAGSAVDVVWENPQGWDVEHADLYYTLDDGVSWTALALGVVGTRVTWTVPAARSDAARVRVYIFDQAGVLGYDTSDEPFSILDGTTGTGGPDVPAVYALHGNVPNPFSPMTRIDFDLPVGSRVDLRIFDAKGRIVKQLVGGWMPAGRQHVIWHGEDTGGRQVASGVYFYELRAGEFEARKRMVMLH